MSSCPNDPSCGFVVIGKKTGDGLRGREAVKLEAREHCYLRDHETISSENCQSWRWRLFCRIFE